MGMGMETESGGTGATPAAVTRADYERAEQYLPWNVKPAIFDARVEPHWIGERDRFWYKREAGGAKAFVLVDPEAATRQPAFDHARLATALSDATGTTYAADDLPFDELTFVDDEQGISVVVDGVAWTCALDTYDCRRGEPVEPKRKDEVRSPDGRWAAFTRDGNLFVRALASGDERQLTHDAEPYYDYASLAESRLSAITDRAVGKPIPPAVLWSPDSRRLVTYRLDQREVSPLYLLQSTPADGSTRPVLHPYRYPLPGDAHVPQAELLLIDVERGTLTDVATAPLSVGARSPFDQKAIWWSGDGQRVYALRAERYGRAVSLLAIDAATGQARTVLEEQGATQVYPQHVPSEVTNVREIGEGDAFTWFSTRDGWGHLYLVDGTTGDVTRQLTSGPWTVRDVLHVDSETRTVLFTAGGREPERDPYYRHVYRVTLDGGEPELLTPEDAEHEVTMAPSGQYFIDTYSRVDAPPVSVLRRADGEVSVRLEQADIAALQSRGWRFPERFRVKARDGVTDLYGMIIRPSTYDPNRTYPVLDAIYPGPQTIRTPKAFPAATTGFWQDQALAELGFIVVTIDGMGTPYRSKAFHDAAYGAAFGEAGGLADHVAGLTQLGDRDASMDLERVGIYGHSGGGYASTRAMLRFPEFYKVAVSSAGNHDQLGYNAGWGERWIGVHDGEIYDHQDNIRLAGNLQGKLLLVHGEMDDNVHPSLTLRLVDALITANKDFDLLIIPNTNHGLFDTRRGLAAFEQYTSQGHPYFTRKRWDFFVEHLLDAEPPAGYVIQPPPDQSEPQADRSEGTR
jgi:dipeptidyl-peptidase-4